MCLSSKEAEHVWEGVFQDFPNSDVSAMASVSQAANRDLSLVYSGMSFSFVSDILGSIAPLFDTEDGSTTSQEGSNLCPTSSSSSPGSSSFSSSSSSSSDSDSSCLPPPSLPCTCNRHEQSKADTHSEAAKKPLTFVDLGSGTGRIVIAAALLLFPHFSHFFGIEIQPDLHHIAQRVAQTFSTRSPPLYLHSSLHTSSSSSSPSSATKSPDVRFQCGDILDVANDWSQGDIVLVTATLFNEQFMQRLWRHACALRKGAVFVIASATPRLVPTDIERCWEYLEMPEFPFSFTVFAYRKLCDHNPFADTK